VLTTGDLLTAQRSIRLVSGGTGGWADGTGVNLDWTFHFLGSRAGFYKAAPVKVTVSPSNAAMVTGVTLRMVDRYRYSGAIAKQQEFPLTPAGTMYEGEFEWNSTVNNPAQELSVELATTAPDDPIVLLADPISRRRDFLISFSEAR
jgi:hypothetical protein